MQDLGAVEMTLELIGNPNTPLELFEEALMLIISMLIGGNHKVQESFYRALI